MTMATMVPRISTRITAGKTPPMLIRPSGGFVCLCGKRGKGGGVERRKSGVGMKKGRGKREGQKGRKERGKRGGRGEGKRGGRGDGKGEGQREEGEEEGEGQKGRKGRGKRGGREGRKGGGKRGRRGEVKGGGKREEGRGGKDEG